LLVLALAGSSEELVERIAGQMPKRTAKAFRRQLHKLGPTRLSDVEAAQLAVASAAAQTIGRGAAQVA
jgi:flagellar motor switch protein FliG